MDSNHPIRVVARRTGLSTHLIRMWERRYGAIKPVRTDTNRRLYSDEDIDRLTLLRRATLAGESIGQIASMSTDQLRDLIRRSAPVAPTAEPKSADDNAAAYHLERCLAAMRDFDANGLESRLLAASVAMGQQTFLEKVLQPLLDRTGQMWTDGRIKIGKRFEPETFSEYTCRSTAS